MTVELSNSNEAAAFDDLDRQLLARLMRQGRATWSDLAADLELTAPAIAARVRRMEDQGVIRQFAAWVAPEAVAPICAFVHLDLVRPESREKFRRQVSALDYVQECHRLAGAHEYLLKVRCATLRALEDVLNRILPALPGVGAVRSSVVLSTVKDTPVLPLPGTEEE